MVYTLVDGGGAEAVAARLMQQLGVPADVLLTLLVTSTVKGYLRWLEKSGEITMVVEDGIRWRK